MTKLAAATPPKDTDVAPLKSVPVMTTEVPPELGPVVGLMDVTPGGTSLYRADVNHSRSRYREAVSPRSSLTR